MNMNDYKYNPKAFNPVKLNTNYSIPNPSSLSIPVNNLKTKSPSNAPEQNNMMGSKVLESIGGGLNNGLNSALGLYNASQAPSKAQRTMGMADAGVDALANVASAFGPIGSVVGGGIKLINSIGGKFVKDTAAIKDFGVNEDLSSGYGGISSQAQDVSSDINAYKKSGLVGKLSSRSKISRAAAINTGKQYAASQVTNQQSKIKDATSNSTDMLAMNSTRKLRKDNPGLAILSKKGGSIGRFKKGGSIILSGSLHARKHDINKEKGLLKDVDITDKGVPVILINKKGGEMIAEFEKEEIIFRKEIIDEIDELREKYKKEDIEEEKNDILFEIGKMLTKEILFKTKDKDKLIDDID